MPNTLNGPIRVLRSKTAGVVPLASDVVDGQLMLNQADVKLYAKNAAGQVRDLVAGHPDIAAVQQSVTALQTSVSAVLNGSPTSLDSFAEAFTRFTNNETLISDRLVKSQNLDDVPDKAAARTALGLDNVNNTSDANKPISSAVQTALDAKLSTSSFASTLAAADVPTPTRDLAPANKAYVAAQLASATGGSITSSNFNDTLAAATVPTPTRGDAPANKDYVVASVAAAASSSQLSVSIKAGSDIAANRLCSVDVYGLARAIDPVYGIANEIAAPGIRKSDSWSGSSAVSMSQTPVFARRAAFLTNGHYVVVLNAHVPTSQGGNNQYSPRFSVVNKVGVVVADRVPVRDADNYSQGGAQAMRVVALTTGKFVVVMPTDGSTLAAAIYNNDGTLVSALSTVASSLYAATSAPSGSYWDVVALAGGNWALMYANASASYQIATVVYSDTKTVVRAATNHGNNSSTGAYNALIPMLDGGFVALSHANCQIARFSSTGAAVGVVINPAGATAANSSAPVGTVAELPDGSVAMSFCGAASVASIAVINPAFTAVSASWTTGLTAGQNAPLCKWPGGILGLKHDNGYHGVWSQTGAVVSAVNSGPFGSALANGGFRLLVPFSRNGADYVRFVANWWDSGTNWTPCNISIVKASTSAVVASYSHNLSNGPVYVGFADDGRMLDVSAGGGGSSSSYTYAYLIDIEQHSVAGVSAAAAVTGAMISLKVEGNFQLDSQDFGAPATGWVSSSFNNTASPLRGSKGFIYNGSNAVLAGLF